MTAEYVNYSCDVCGEPRRMRLSKFKVSIRHFCGKACYTAYQHSPEAKLEKDGQRIARVVLNEKNRYPVQPGQAVGFIDGDPGNTAYDNLKIYGSQEEKINAELNRTRA